MSLDELMKSLRAEYLTELPLKIKQIEDLFLEENSTELRDMFHKLKGTGKTYGIPELSTLAEFVEKTLLGKPKEALIYGKVFLKLLREIYQARAKDLEFDIQKDPRFLALIQNQTKNQS